MTTALGSPMALTERLRRDWIGRYRSALADAQTHGGVGDRTPHQWAVHCADQVLTYTDNLTPQELADLYAGSRAPWSEDPTSLVWISVRRAGITAHDGRTLPSTGCGRSMVAGGLRMPAHEAAEIPRVLWCRRCTTT